MICIDQILLIIIIAPIIIVAIYYYQTTVIKNIEEIEREDKWLHI